MKTRKLYLIIAVLAIINIFTLYKLNTLENNIVSRIRNLENSQRDIAYEIDSIYSNVNAMLKKEASILDSYYIELGDLNPDDFTIPVTVTITPKEYTDDLIAMLQLNDRSIQMQKDGTSFNVTGDTNVFDDVVIKINLKQGDVLKTETLDEYYDLKSKYLLDISGGYSGETSYKPNKYIYNGIIDLNFGCYENNSPVEFSIVEEVNGKVVNEVPVKEPVIESNSISIPINREVEIEPGSKVLIYTNVKDKYGLNYKYLVLSQYLAMDDKHSRIEEYPYTHSIVEISDENGNVLWEQDI